MSRECVITLPKVSGFMKVLAGVKSSLEIRHGEFEMEFEVVLLVLMQNYENSFSLFTFEF